MFELLKEVVTLCVKITQGSKADVFFEYSGHINRFDVRVYKNAWKEHTDPEHICFFGAMDEKTMTYARDKLLELAKELNVEI